MTIKISNIFKGDKILWNALAILAILSIIAVYSATGALAYQQHNGDTSYYLYRHSLFMAFGILVIIVTQFIPYKIYIKSAYIIYGISIFFLILTFFFGETKNEATRWLNLPVINIDFQPSDLAKFAIVMVTAKILAQNQNNKEGLKKAVTKIIMLTAAMVIFIFPSDFSSALLLIVTVGIIMYVGRVKFKYLLATTGIAFIVLSFFILIIMNSGHGRFNTWKARIESFTGDNENSDGNYQVNNAKMAIVTGGFFGKGPGNSIHRNSLPQSYSDFIFAFIVEEYGAFGGIFVLIVYLWILYRGMLIVRKTKKAFPVLLGLGLIISLSIQAFTNMLVAVNIFPVTGQTLPFVSMGGTSIFFTAVTFGILLNISRKENLKIREED